MRTSPIGVRRSTVLTTPGIRVSTMAIRTTTLSTTALVSVPFGLFSYLTMADEQIITAIKNYIYLLNDEGFGINRAFLYGSYASGKNSESSDIDLMLLSESLDEKDNQKKSRAWILTKKIDSRIEPYLVNINRFDKDENSPLFEIVRREGLEIHF